MLLDHLERHARERGEATALFWAPEGRSVSWRQLWADVTARAATLGKHDLAGEPVLIFGANDPDSVISFLGAMRAGLTPSFMPLPAARFDPSAYWTQHQTLFRHIGRGALIAPEASLPQLRTSCPDNPLALIAAETLAEGGDGPIPSRPAADTVALLQHSSGTTGLKKGVALSFAAIERQVQAYRQTLDFGPDAVIASWLPLYHDMGLVACLLLPLSVGARATFLDPFQWTARPQLLFDAIEDSKATHVWLPNFAFRHLVRAVRPRDERWALGSVRAWINCSEPCKPAAFDAFIERYGDHGVSAGALACCYAMAETVFAVSQTSPGEPPRRRRIAADGFGEPGVKVREADECAPSVDVLSCGRPLPDCRIVIEGSEDGEEVFGQILVSAPFLFEGYHKDPDRTARALRDGWYATGDVGFLSGGELFVCGRLDDRIIVGGRNLYAHEIEQLASGVAGVIPGRAVAIGVPDEETGTERLVIAAEIGDADPAGVTARLIEAIDAGMGLRPTDVRLFRDRRIIKTTSGKLDRKKNRERYLDGGFS